MITLAWYLLKVIICSGILCGYYFLALRNKVFHRWNRFYLLAAMVISLLAPVIKIDIFQNNGDNGTVVQMLQTISYGDEAVVEYSRNSGFQINTENLAEGTYLLISVIFLIVFLVSLYKIKRLKERYPHTRIEGIFFVNTNAKGTPFSFFKSIFWNNAINLHSSSGQQIFNHEIAHVQEKHSYDKIFMNLVLVFFWINPFFWLMRKELYMIHEFVADKEALEDSDINAFAEMILQTVYPGQNFSAINSFFYSPLKRRIKMLTKNKNAKVSYVSRLLVLPLAAIVFFAFTLKVNSTDKINSYTGKTITVVIDAGHGGDDIGASSANGLKEKDVTLSIAKKIASLNSNERINILLSRDNDQSTSVKDRVHFAKDHNADLFVSIHVKRAVNEQLNGFSVLIDRNNTEKNQLLASALINELKATYKTNNEIEVRNRGLVVVDSNSCPAAVVECGYISNSTDVEFISKDANQEKIAKDILNAINNYLALLQNNADNITPISGIANSPAKSADTTHSIYYKGKKVKNLEVKSLSKQIKVTANVIKVTYEDGSTEMISKNEADKRGFILPGLANSYFKTNALFVINGKIATNDTKINPNDIKSINILKGEQGISKYGQKGKNGVIEIKTKDKSETSWLLTADTIHVHDLSSGSRDDVKATGKKAVFLDSKIPPNTLIIIDGKESSRQELNKIDPRNIESVSVLKRGAVLKYGEKGKDGVIEITTKEKGITAITNDRKIKDDFKKDTLPGKLFTQSETPASFPGGQQAWVKYIVKEIQASIDSFTNEDYGTCVVKFIVKVDGTVIDVKATTMEGTHLAKTAIDAIKKGPKWIPAKQNGRDVASYRLQPVTLTNPDDNKKSATKTEKVDNRNVFTKIDQPATFSRRPNFVVKIHFRRN